ncbi:MAG: hypothetical protein LBV04_00120 [Deferribacteraceae bacterium]|jgi:hypothetical protein|nr:hypothetical protein [Deferribacteraceae bacterium]
MVNGITTVISSSVITEKIADAQGRMAENNQLATTAVVQEQVQKNLSTVQQLGKAETARKVDKKTKKEQEEKKKRPSSGDTGKNLDLEA